MKAGPKVAVDGSSLSLRGSRRREPAVARFALDSVRVPRGHGARKPLRLRPWQRSLIASTWDARPDPEWRLDAPSRPGQDLVDGRPRPL
jgi:hypothetical protein